MHISRLDARTGESKLQPIVPALSRRMLLRLAGVTPAYLAAEAGRMIESMRGAAPALAAELRATLATDEIDFLAERVNPVVRERCAWWQNGLA